VNLMMDTNALSSFAEGGPEVTARISESQVVANSVDRFGRAPFRSLPARTEALRPAHRVHDLWIAALCRQHGYGLLSRDLHFDAVAGLRRVSW
jgi:predicted nucleic acid-binding protein